MELSDYSAVEIHSLASLAEKEAERLASKDGLHAHRLQRLATRLRHDALRAGESGGRAA